MTWCPAENRLAPGDRLPTLYAGTLERAAELVGGEEQLALRLLVTPSHLALWMRGLASPPGDIFLKAADIVMEEDLRRLRTQQAHEATSER